MRTAIASLLLVLAAGPGCARGGDSEAVALATATRGDPDRGASAIGRLGCGSCHVVPGVARARGLVGPPLSDFARRSFIAGRMPNTADNLIAWIRWPDSLEPGTVMPTLGVTPADARDIAAYLYLETATGGWGPPRLLSPTLLKQE
jgi:cytochrome c